MCQYDIFSKLYKTPESVRKTVYQQMINNRILNPDGTGIYAYNLKDKKAIIWKFYGKQPDSDIQEIFDSFEKNVKNYSLVIIHNRWGTSGSKGLSQCHPLPIIHCDEYGRNQLNGWFAFHNGVCDGYDAKDADNLSDTQVMAYDLGQWIYDHDIKSPKDFGNKKWRKFWESKFSGSKVTIVHGDDYYTINSNLGVVEDGVWKSSSGKSIITYGGGYSNDPYWESYDEQIPAKKYDVPEAEREYWKRQGFSDAEIDELYSDPDWDPIEACQGIPDYDPKHKAS